MAGALPAFGAAYVGIEVSSSAAASAINALRASNRRAPLTPDGALQRAAAHQAELMAELDEISHRLRGQALPSRVRRAGYDGLAGENLSAGRTALAAVLDGWMNSPGHRRNMLDPRFSEFGIAAARVAPDRPSRYRTYWALIFGIPAG